MTQAPLAPPTTYSHLLDDEDLHVNVGLAQLFQRGILRVVVPCLSQLKRRKLQHDDGERRLPFQGQKPRGGVAPDQRFAAVLPGRPPSGDTPSPMPSPEVLIDLVQ